MSDFLTWASPVARKNHECDQCYRVIQPGETYTRGSGMYEGSWFTWRECAHCHQLLQIWNIYEAVFDDGVGPDDICEFEPSGSPSEYPLRFIRWYRHRAQYIKKWARKDGTLYPLPEREESND